MAVDIQPVRTSKDLDAFVKLPWRLYADDPHWVPPLRGEVRNQFNPRKNPFFEHGEIQPYLARREGRVVGRIAGIRNTAHETFHGEPVGFFGFFESENDQETAGALLDTAAGFLKERGLRVVRGPVNPSTNDECGLLVDGFDTPPMILMTHNLPYYERLLTGWGLEKAKDLYAFVLKTDTIPERVAQGVRIARKRNRDIRIRSLDMKHFDREIEVFRTVYNAAWEKNWGFVPMTDAEIDHMAAQLKQAIDPGLVRIAEHGGKPVAFALGLPDLNQAIRHADGRLFPFGLLKILWHARKIDRARVAVLGILKEYRRTALDMILYHDLYRYGLQKGYTTGEFSWVLEDNAAMTQPLEKFGASIYKTYRIFDAPLDRT